MKQIAIKFFPLVLLVTLISCIKQTNEIPVEEIPHYERKDNFTVLRVIILNAENQILMTNDQGYWGMPWVNLTKRQFLNEALDSMAFEHGIEIVDVELRGQFYFKYDYKPNVTLRNFYVAQYKSGSIKLPKNTIETKFEDVKWVDIPKAIERNSNNGIKEITRHILNNPDTVWGGSFMVSRTGHDHPTKLLEDFYPLFKLQVKGQE